MRPVLRQRSMLSSASGTVVGRDRLTHPILRDDMADASLDDVAQPHRVLMPVSVPLALREGAGEAVRAARLSVLAARPVAVEAMALQMRESALNAQAISVRKSIA